MKSKIGALVLFVAYTTAWLGMAAWSFLNRAEDPVMGITGMISCVLISLVGILGIIEIFVIVDLTSDGCTVKWLWIKKEYRWEEIHLVYNDITRKYRTDTLYFSARTVNCRGKKLTKDNFMPDFNLHFLTDFCICWKNNEEKKKTMAQLEQWGVKVEISDIVKHEELIDAKTKARNERRRLYEERKRQAKNKKNTNS